MSVNSLTSNPRLSKLLFVFSTIGDAFLKVLSFSAIVKRYVYNEEPQQDKKPDDEAAIFRAESQSLQFLHPELLMPEKERFAEFHNFTVMSGQPIATVLLSTKDNCTICSKPLSLEHKTHTVVIYSLHRGTYLGSRMTKVCRRCKIHQYYGYHTQDGQKRYDHDVLHLDYLQSSEDTAFDIQLLKECGSLLVLGALPFSTYASSYNKRFGYNKKEKQGDHNPAVKRIKRYVPPSQIQISNSHVFLLMLTCSHLFVVFMTVKILHRLRSTQLQLQ